MLVVWYLCLVGAIFLPARLAAEGPAHPRLYFARAELPQLRNLRAHPSHKRIWHNLQDSAEWCLKLSPRKQWIAPVATDPDYENLYDRFYAIMGDLAVTEHLSFAYAFSGDQKYGEAARLWTLASCRAWKQEAQSEPDGSKAYAVTRLLKGAAIGYDIAWERFTEDERREIRDTLQSIAEKYYQGYFTTPAIAGPDFHTHHAIVEWASFGVTALTLLDEVPQAKLWLEATIRKFEDHLLPSGLAPDGAQVEGPTYWASTMQYRIFFMDALRRVTGHDLFSKFQSVMNADLALAAIATTTAPGYSQSHASVILSPSYGQLDYYSPVLLFLAREYRRPVCQYLASWDKSLGSIQQCRYITPHGERLLFELGGYAFLWYDSNIAAKPENTKLTYHFPSVDEAYLRASWAPNDLLLGIRKGELLVHCGGQSVLIEPMDWRDATNGLHIARVEDNGSLAAIHCTNSAGEVLTAELHRPNRAVIHRRLKTDWQWWCQGAPGLKGDSLRWKDGATLRVRTGKLANWEPNGYAPVLSAGFGKLKMADPAPMTFPLCTVRPDTGDEIVIEVAR